MLTLACLLDWVIDRRQETPLVLRQVLFFGQAVLWVLSGALLVLGPICRRLSNTRLALYVERKVPDLDHRLISAVQLNQPRADTRGMSPTLIGLVTREAENWVKALDCASLADHRRLSWAAAVVAPILVVAGVCFLLWPDTVQALVARQFLQDCDIPRSVYLESVDPDRIGIAGQEVVLTFHAFGSRLSEDLQGELRIDPEGQPSVQFPLVFKEMTASNEALFEATVPPSVVDYAYRAWLADGRLRQPAHVHIESYPVVVEQQAWVRLPSWCGKRPDGQPFEMEQPRGDIFALPGSTPA